MGFQELKSAITDAFHRREYETALQLLDPALEEVTGDERIDALALKVSILMCISPKRAPEALVLVNESLELAHFNPVQTMWGLVNALAVCYLMGDVDQARRYEVACHRLLQEHGDDPIIVKNRFRLHGNMALIASLRGEYATAYWQFVQGLTGLQSCERTEGIVRHLVRTHFYIIDTCLRMNRIPEAWESLEKSRNLGLTEDEQVQWTVLKAKLLRYSGRAQEANTLLLSLPHGDSAQWQPATAAQYHLVRAQTSQDLGELREFHHHLSRAHSIAVDHCLEFQLCEIQRTQRMPLLMGVGE